MSVINLRPNAKYEMGWGEWWTNGSSVWQALAADDGTATRVKKNNFEESYVLSFQDISGLVPAGSTVNWIRVWMMNKYRDDNNNSTAEAIPTFIPNLGNYYSSRANRASGSGQTVYTDSGLQIYTKIAGGAFTLAELDTFVVQLSSVGQINGADSAVSHVWYEVWLEVDYTTHQVPSTPTGLARTGDVTDTTPNFSAVVSDPDGNTVKARFEIYQSDGTTFVGTVDSAFVSSGGTAVAEYSSPLAVGSYKVRAKTIDSEAMESGWTSLVSFDVKASIFKDLIQIWNTYAYATNNAILIWNVDAGNVKDLRVFWDVLEVAGLKDLVLLWNQTTPWTKLPESPTTWTRVEEL